MNAAVADREGEPARIDPAATLIVTRPEPEATRLVDALVARGRRAWALPVLAIEDGPDEAALQRAMVAVTDYALVVFVSPNAIRRALAVRDSAWPAAVTIGVMGPGSVDTLAALGVAAPAQRVVSPPADATPKQDSDRFDSEALFAALEATIGLGVDFAGRALIVRGNGGRAWFADRLRELGIAVDEIEAYRRVRPTADPRQATALRKAFAANETPAFVVTSSEGVPNLVAIVGEGLGDVASPVAARDWLFGCTVVAPHRRIAARARDAGFRRVVTTASGDRGILAAIE